MERKKNLKVFERDSCYKILECLNCNFKIYYFKLIFKFVVIRIWFIIDVLF